MSDSIDDALGDDHTALGRLLAELTQSIESAGPGAPALLEAFSRGLFHHMDWEDRVLFPAVRKHATAAQKKSIESLGIDHERLRDTLKELRQALADKNAADARSRVRWLRTLLDGHNYDEEHGVYVEAEKYLSAGERRRLIADFRGGPA